MHYAVFCLSDDASPYNRTPTVFESISWISVRTLDGISPFLNAMKPKPRLNLPRFLSTTMEASTSSPYFAKCLASMWSLVELVRPPTKIRPVCRMFASGRVIGVKFSLPRCFRFGTRLLLLDVRV